MMPKYTVKIAAVIALFIATTSINTAKIYWWDGNTPLHEWTYPLEDRPKIIKDEFGFESKDREEPTPDVITWIFEEGTFKPAAKLTENGNYYIITDYLGTPAQMYDAKGKVTWETELDIYGRVRKFTGSSLSDCPFRYQGQYHDEETGLYYNRFRYYSPDEGIYISQDPIGLEGNNPTLYGYVKDVNTLVDLFGLDFYYQLIKGTKIVYHGITERKINFRVEEHFNDGKIFDQVRYLEVNGRDASRDLEGSALHNEWNARNKGLLNAQRTSTPGYYHSYDPKNIKPGRNMLSNDDIENAMIKAEKKKVSNGKICK
jgi:RHS repeat-associated protein